MPQNKDTNGTLRQSRRLPLATAIGGLIWLAVIATATVLMLAHAGAPGEASTPPAVWPASSKVPHDQARPTLVLFVHPRCPCSRATIGELAVLMAHAQGKVNVRALFLRPAGTSTDWAESDTWHQAAAIPGVAVQGDDAGTEARRFGMKTSGDAALYAADGRLLFHGGLTISRGHAGDNPGRDTLLALLHNEPTPATQTPVFGCALFEPGTNGLASTECRKERLQP